MRKTIVMLGLAMGLAVTLAGLVGCNRDQPKKNYKGPFDGTAVEVNSETNEVSMKLVHPERGITMTAKGYVNEKTQVEVNGVTARVEDIHEGDPVKVTGYYEGSGDNRRFIVTTISVRRADNAWIKSGDAPATATAPAGAAE